MNTDTALAFLEFCASSNDLPPVLDQFHKTIAAYGFSCCTAGGWAGLGKQRSYRYYFSTWPQAWIEIYNREAFFRDDPFVQESFRRMTGFSLRELDSSKSLTVRGREIIKAVRDFGWTEVFGIPVHGPAGYQGFVSMASMGPVELTPLDKSLLQSIGHAIHDRCHSTVGFGISDLKTPLSGREIECLQWAAVGKTDWEISQVLGVSPSTTHYHIEQAKKKLGVNSRVQAVALAVLRGMV